MVTRQDLFEALAYDTIYDFLSIEGHQVDNTVLVWLAKEILYQVYSEDLLTYKKILVAVAEELRQYDEEVK